MPRWLSVRLENVGTAIGKNSPKKHTLKQFKLIIPRPGRDNADYPDVIDVAAIHLWREAMSSLQTVTRIIDGKPVQLTFDWSSIAEYRQRSYEAEISMPSAIYALWDDDFRRRVELAQALCPVIVTISSNEDRVRTHDIENAIQDIFLTLNLACPGSLNLYRAKLIDEESTETELELSSNVFDVAWINSLRESSSSVRTLELSNVVTWMTSQNLDGDELADSGTSKALFCLLHLSTSWHYEPTSLLWISHALEALYRVPNALSFNFLRDRMFLLFETPPRNKKRIAKELREFFDSRNAFAHGGMRIARPHASSYGTGPLWEHQTMILEKFDIGSRFVVSSIQRMIQLKLQDLQFQELLIGADR